MRFPGKALLVVVALFTSSGRARDGDAAPHRRDGTLNVAVLVVDGIELLDASGPAEVFVAASLQGDRKYEVYTVAPRKGAIGIRGFGRLEPDHGFEDCPPPDILVVPGGGIVARLEDAQILDWIRARARTDCVLLSVCTGALALARAGLLDGLEATTHRNALEALRKAAPRARVVEGRRYVDNGRVVTSAGVSSGIDAALHLVARFSGAETAAKTVRYLEWTGARAPSGGER